MYLILIVLIFRTAYLQLINTKKLSRECDLRSIRINKIPATRGIISDRFGNFLAVNISMNTIWADPKKLYEHGVINTNNVKWKNFSNILSIPIDKLEEKINSNKKKRFIYLARHIPSVLSDYINKLELPGIYSFQEFRRYYPEGKSTAHVVGIANIDNKGIDGIEKKFDSFLSGKPGKSIVRKDGLGNFIENIEFIDKKKANNLILSIDKKLQKLAYYELKKAVKCCKAESGSVVLIDIKTGEILVMTNIPSYNPNNLKKILKKNMRNISVTDVFEPGSTIKPIVIMSALENNIIKENTIINTFPYFVNGYKIQDTLNYKELSITEILKKSSNVGISKIALSMPFSSLIDTFLCFGIGKKTNLELIGERKGWIPNRKKWSDIEKATFSYGYGMVMTPLQLARIYAIIGRMGMIIPLSITRVDCPVQGEQIFPKFLARTIISMMEAVSLPGGTGVKAAIKGYRIAVKTGTVKKVGKNGTYINEYIAYTNGIAPVSNPRFSLVVVINNPNSKQYYGGTISAPVFKKIMDQALKTMNIDPDKLK